MSKGMGRFHAPDERDKDFLLRGVMGSPSLDSLPTYKYWYSPYCLDQGYEPKCVGYSTKTMLLNGPIQQRGEHPTADEIYAYAQSHDAWPGTDYDGTSVRAGMKAAVYFGKVTEYRWAFTLEDVIRWLLTSGPLVVGFDWYSGCSVPDERHFMHPEGEHEGGHAFGLIGANTEQEKVRVLNNWGRDWADNGKAWLSFEALEFLLNSNGEAACAVEKGA